ncbi:hypothetical protein [Photobacterium damselae]|uniref:hypothetical protein n=1 Tax=Photobacterium damselae TaxID=38293 RepID=UPI0012AE8E96|nr:hypothetical protein [Photobacterium damselae]
MMKFSIAKEQLLPLNSSIETKRVNPRFIELRVKAMDCTDSIVLSDCELEEAILQISRSKRSLSARSISYWELREYQINVWGRSNYWRFKNLTQNKAVTISRGFIVYLLQEILECKVNRLQGTAHESISHFLGLGSQESCGDRQIRRYREKAAKYIVSSYSHLLEQGTEKFARETISNFILMQLFQAFNYIAEKISKIKAYILPTPLKMIQRVVANKSVSNLKETVNKILGHIFPKTCPLPTSL